MSKETKIIAFPSNNEQASAEDFTSLSHLFSYRELILRETENKAKINCIELQKMIKNGRLKSVNFN